MYGVLLAAVPTVAEGAVTIEAVTKQKETLFCLPH